MLVFKRFDISSLLLIISISGFLCEDQPTATDDNGATTSADLMASATGLGYDKRPAGHSFVRFGKRDGNNKGHSFLYFGKRNSPEENNFAELLQYLQRSQEPSWKRGHSIMRFGKRVPDKHNFMRFGKRSVPDGDLDEDVKRASHSMMYFGKRNGHSMLYFGKRSPYDDYPMDMDKKAGHSMMYFGKRGDTPKSAGHSMMYFGKRGDGSKSSGHSMMYFGKRFDPDLDEDKRAGHSMMYFGKRMLPDIDEDKRGGHSMMYFGKREDSTMDDDLSMEPDDIKRATHEMIRFGKRGTGGYDLNNGWRQISGPFSTLNNRYFSSIPANGRVRSQTMDKKKHNMMHFGKRSVDAEASSGAAQEKSGDIKHDRKKRDVNSGMIPFVPIYEIDPYDEYDEEIINDMDQQLVPSKDSQSSEEQQPKTNAEFEKH